MANMAHRGCPIANEAEIPTRLGWQFDPDLLVLQSLRNDGPSSGPDFRPVGGTRLLPDRYMVPVRFQTGPVQSSALLGVTEEGFSILLRPGRSYHVRRAGHPDDLSLSSSPDPRQPRPIP